MNGIEQIEGTRKRALGSTPFPGQAKSDPSAAIPRQQVLFDSGPAPARARWSDPPTSHEAARSVIHIRESQQFILSVLQVDGPLTDEELFAAVTHRGRRISPSGCRTRRSELVKLGLICDSDKRKRLSSGRFSIVWMAAENE